MVQDDGVAGGDNEQTGSSSAAAALVTGTSSVSATATAAGDGGAESSGSGGQPAASSSSSSNSKRKRVVLSILEKQQVLQRLEEGEQPLAIARAYGISRQQVSDIKKNRERILSFCVDATHVASLRRKTLKVTSVYHPGVEQELYRWLVRQRLLGRVIVADALTKKAMELFTQYSGEDSNVPFKTIMNWLRHFKRAHGIKALNDEEISRLPERFVPAMDMAQELFAGEDTIQSHQSQQQQQIMAFNTNSSGSSSFSTNILAPQTASATPSSYAEVYMTSSTMGLHATPQQQQQLTQLQQHGNNALKSPLMSAVTTIHEINAQLSFFERAMALKLDDLDARVEKLGFLVLPP